MRALTIAALALGLAGAGLRRAGPASPRNAIRVFNRRWFNPLMLRLAGRRPWPVARLEHRGRRSGAFRATPVLAWPVMGGFIVPMPYGTDVDWARNLCHAGEGVLQYGNVRYRVGNPRVVPVREGAGDLPFPIGPLIRNSWIRLLLRVDVLASLISEVRLPV